MQINIIGFGNMGQAIAKALVAKKFKAKIIASDRQHKKMSGVVFDAGFKTLPKADVVIIAVKPQDAPALASEIRMLIGKKSIIISIAAGVPIKKLEKLFNSKKIVRMMPNLGLLVGQGIATWKGNVSAADKKTAKRLVNAFTENFEVADERLIDATTAISGSGPAYFFFVAKALASAAQDLGLSAAQSKKLVEKTLTAAAMLQGNEDYEALIKRIRSKKGTTDAALKLFQRQGLPKIIRSGVVAAYMRAKELSK